MNISLTAAEAFAIKAAAAHRRDLRTIAARITPEQIADQARAERSREARPDNITPCGACPYARDSSAL